MVESITGHAIPVWPFNLDMLVEELERVPRWEVSPMLRFFGFHEYHCGTDQDVWERRDQDFVIKRQRIDGRTGDVHQVLNYIQRSPEHRRKLLVPTWRYRGMIIQRFAMVGECPAEMLVCARAAGLSDIIPSNVGRIGTQYFIVDADLERL